MHVFPWRNVETDGPDSAGFQVWVAYRNPYHPNGWNLIVEWTPLSSSNAHLTINEHTMWKPIDFPECPSLPDNSITLKG